MAFHTPHGSARFRLPWSWWSFDYRELCASCGPSADARFEIAKVEGRTGETVAHRPRGPARAADRRRARLAPRARPGANVQPPEAPITRGLEVHPHGGGTDLDVWIDRSLVRYGYAWSVPGGRRAARRRRLLRAAPPRQGADARRSPRGSASSRRATRATGSRTRCAPAAEDGVFFVGDSAGHCFPLSGEGIRTAFYFGIAAGRELRAVLAGEQLREAALAAYGAFSRGPRAGLRRALRAPARDPRAAAAAADRACSRCWRAAACRRPRVRLVPATQARTPNAGARSGGSAAPDHSRS